MPGTSTYYVVLGVVESAAHRCEREPWTYLDMVKKQFVKKYRHLSAGWNGTVSTASGGKRLHRFRDSDCMRFVSCASSGKTTSTVLKMESFKKRIVTFRP